jgi:hypothetical protein
VVHDDAVPREQAHGIVLPRVDERLTEHRENFLREHLGDICDIMRNYDGRKSRPGGNALYVPDKAAD